MLEINPVLAGTFDRPDYAPAASNINSGTENANGVDARLYTKFDRSASDVATVTDFKFSDILDIINPLQHIPLVSDAYRAITGDEIRPYARVAGDILYGGLLGGASAIMGGVGGVADATLEQATGKDSGSTVLAALFGPGENPAEVQVASAEVSTPAAVPAASVEVAEDKTDTQTSVVAAEAAAVIAPPPTLPTPQMVASAAPVTTLADATASGTIPLTAAKAFPLKQPYGGVMAPTNRTAEQNMALALSAAAPGMRIGNTIYTSPLMNGPKPLKLLNRVEPSPAPQTAPAPAAAAGAPDTPQAAAQAAPTEGEKHNPLPQELINDMMLQAMSRYRSVAGGQSIPGTNVNVTN